MGLVRVGNVIAAVALALILAGGCGGRSQLFDYEPGAGDGGVGSEGGLQGCGDGTCRGAETCANCSVDCGLCSGCGDGTCSSTETCSSCPQDCGVCATCGDGFCKGGETCLTCAPDCGPCPSCGDHTCQAANGEDCFTCPEDCGKCAGCGDGLCTAPETCASCEQDCGVCSVCGNMKCEAPYETCANCPSDCGDCVTIGCFEMLTCAFPCIDATSSPPMVSVSCVGDCVARGCASAQYFFDQAFDCFVANIGTCGANLTCLESACDSQVAACIGSHCPSGG